MPDKTINQGDGFEIGGVLKQPDGAGGLTTVDGAAALSVDFEMKHMSNPAASFQKAATILVVNPLTVKFVGGASDSAVPGIYEGRFQVNWINGTKTHFPNGTPIDILITEELVAG